jgi:hypothetical protein
MKAIETNIYRHKNGTLYFVARRHGKLHVRSLGTQDLEEARRTLREKGMEYFFYSRLQKRSEAREESDRSGKRRKPQLTKTSPPAPAISMEERKPSSAPVVQNTPQLNQNISLEDLLNKHDSELTFTKPGTLKMIQTARAAISRFCPSLEEFSCIDIWKEYQAKGLRKTPRRVGAATNHLLWYFRSLIPWAVEQSYLPSEQSKKLEKLGKTQVNSRCIRITAPEKLEELLQMVESEDPDGAAFLRFLACAGIVSRL